jgi:hypothetical protein
MEGIVLAMATLVLRAAKGSPLTFAEVDSNFTELDTDATQALADAAAAAKLDVAQTFTAAQRGTVVALTPGATVTPDFSAGNNFSLALGENTTLANPTNIAAGQSGAITITQDSTARTLAYGNQWHFESGVPTLGTTTGAVSTLVYYADTTTRITAVLLNEPANS